MGLEPAWPGARNKSWESAQLETGPLRSWECQWRAWEALGKCLSSTTMCLGCHSPAFSQFSSVTQLCLTLRDPMDCSMPGFPVHHQLLEFTQTHVYRVSDAIQPSHPLLSPLFPPSVFPSIRVFSNASVLCIRWPKYWNFCFSISPSNEHPGLISFRMDWLDLLAVQGTLRSLHQL